MGRFSDLDLDGLDSIDVDDNDLDPEGLKDFLADSEPLSEGETSALQLQCLLSELVSLNNTLEALIIRAKYYAEEISVGIVEEIRDELKKKIRDFQ